MIVVLALAAFVAIVLVSEAMQFATSVAAKINVALNGGL